MEGFSGASELRRKWIDFFTKRGHLDVSNRSLIPSSTDKSLLFINSGIAAIKDYFYGNTPSPSGRLVSCQKVIRTGDIDSIGSSYRHHTYFEMLGNFSIGDYFKTEAIQWAWEFITQSIDLDPNRIYVTIFSEDNEAREEWRKYLPDSRIIDGNRETNFWDMGVGPCGPCTEIYYDKGEKYDPQGIGIDLLKKNINNERYIEIWNIVFSEYLNVDGEIVRATTKNIDTGAGLERLLSLMEGKDSNFDTSLFGPILDLLESTLNLPKEKLWAIADYLRTSCLLLNDGILFGAKGREYVLRRIFRKSLYLMGSWKPKGDFFGDLASTVASTLPYHSWDIGFVAEKFREEYALYRRTRDQAVAILEEVMVRYPETIPAKEIFNLVSTHGLDYWTMESIVEEEGRNFSREEYMELERRHREVSFNSNISSAFTKKIPSLLELQVPSRLDYESASIKSPIVALFDEEFRRVEEIGDVGYVVLDTTVVYPLAGGQDSDDGWINGKQIITSLKAPNGQILHKVSGPLRVGEIVEIKHDKERRKHLELHHSLEHLLYELLKREIHPDLERYSGNKYRDHFTLEVRTPKEINRDSFDIGDLNKKLQRLIDENLPVSISHITLEESKKLGLPQNFEEVYRKSSEELRYVNIGDYSRELCFGTHVKSTSQIDKCLIVEFKRKQSSVYRFRVLGGPYALKELGGKSLGEYFSPEDEEEQKRIKAQRREEFQSLKRELIGEILESKENFLVLERKMEVELALETFKELGRKIENRTVLLHFRDDSGGMRFFVVSDRVDVGKLLKKLRDEYGWKCGGNRGFGSGVAEGDGFVERFMEQFRKI